MQVVTGRLQVGYRSDTGRLEVGYKWLQVVCRLLRVVTSRLQVFTGRFREVTSGLQVGCRWL